MKTVLVVVWFALTGAALAQPRPLAEVDREAKQYSLEVKSACRQEISDLRQPLGNAICPRGFKDDPDPLVHGRQVLDQCELVEGRREPAVRAISLLDACVQDIAKRRVERKEIAATRPLAELQAIPKQYRLPEEQVRIDGPAKTGEVTKAPGDLKGPASPPSSVKAIKYPSGVYAGELTRSERDRSGRCKWSAERRLTLTVNVRGEVSWVGYAFENIVCPGEHSQPMSCWHEGTGTLNPAKKLWALAATTTGIAPGPVEGSGRRIWKCGRLKLVLPDGVPAPKVCVALGPEDDPRALAVADLICREGGNPWSDLASAKLVLAGKTLTLPVLGKSKLKLTRMTDAPSP